MSQIYVLDTSVLIHDPQSIKSFSDHRVVVPLTVLSELDSLKAGNSQASYSARESSRILDSVKESGGSLREFSKLPGTDTFVRVYGFNKDNHGLPKELDINIKDNQILATTLYVKTIYPEEEVVLVSKDTLLRVIAESLGIHAEDYRKDKLDKSELLTKISYTLEVPSDILELLPEVEELELQNLELIKDHSLIDIKDYKNKKGIFVKRSVKQGERIKHYIKSIPYKSILPWDLRAKNQEQLYALYLLMEPSIKIVTISGVTGAGKTLLALAAGLQLTTEEKSYERVVVIRPMVTIGDDIGYLPGDIKSKLEPWVKPIYDNVRFLLKEEDESTTEILFEHKTIEVAPLAYLRGRSINNSYIYIDEAQNLSLSQVKAAISRTGSKSKVIIAGDLDQIDSAYIDKFSCGLVHVAKAFSEEPIAGHAILTKSERSKVAELASKLL